MTRHRKGNRPLSQTGLHRIPSNPGQRNFLEGGAKPKRRTLDAFNDAADDRWLHPTKGWRRLNLKRSRAQMIVAETLAPRHPTVAQESNGRSKYLPHQGRRERERRIRQGLAA